MRRLWFLLALLVVGAPASAQTYTDTTPFVCQAATAAQIQLPFGYFNCRGIFYDGNKVELFFNGGRAEVFTSFGWAVYNAPISLTTFTQPNPAYCPVRQPGYHTGCPAGTVPGTFSFNWSGTGTDGLPHNGSVSGTWENVQYCGGERCWYHPVLESSTITIN